MKALTKKSERRQLVRDYLRKYNPQEPARKFGYDIAAISRYAREKNVDIADIPVQELEKFATS